jgi:hypothetical protein
MKFPSLAVVAVLAGVFLPTTTITTTDAFCPTSRHQRRQLHHHQHYQHYQQQQDIQSLRSTASAITTSTTTKNYHGIVARSTKMDEEVVSSSAEGTTTATSTTTNNTRSTQLESLTKDIVSKLRFRELQKELEKRQMDASGTYTDMRQRLLYVAATSSSSTATTAGTGTTTTSPVVNQDETSRIENNKVDGDTPDDSTTTSGQGGNVRVIDQNFLNTVRFGVLCVVVVDVFCVFFTIGCIISCRFRSVSVGVRVWVVCIYPYYPQPFHFTTHSLCTNLSLFLNISYHHISLILSFCVFVCMLQYNIHPQAFQAKGISFMDASDPDFEYNNLVREVLGLAERTHWKSAARKLKTLVRGYGQSSSRPHTIPEKVFTAVLTSYTQDRLHGARAAEPARRAMEEMVANGYSVPGDIANYCIKESLGFDNDGTHEGFGGIDTALAIMAAVSASPIPPIISDDTYEKLASTMATEGSIDDALTLVRELVVDKSMTPSLKMFADIGNACSQGTNDPEKLMTALAYVKAAGYELDKVGSTVDGRALLAAGVIAAEKMGNIGLGLRFLTAASKAEGCEPDRGDTLVATFSPAAQRACTILHRQAINMAAIDNSWKLAVRLLELVLERGLTASPSAWRNVVTCCAKNEKSRKATALLMDWVSPFCCSS